MINIELAKTKCIDFMNKNNISLINFRYGYSVFNLTSDRVIARIFYLNDEHIWLKLDENYNIVEYYKEFSFEVKEGIISEAYDLISLQSIEYYKDSFIKGIKIRKKFDSKTGKYLATDYFISDIQTIQNYVSPENLELIIEFSKKFNKSITYFSSKPYGFVVGFLEDVI